MFNGRVNFTLYGRKFRNNENELESWLDKPVNILLHDRNSYGTIKYGIRLPIRPATHPLEECDVGSKKRIERQTPNFWFNSDENEGLKIRLNKILSVTDDKIVALGNNGYANFNLYVGSVSLLNSAITIYLLKESMY